jgi:hypothetical protein
MAHLAKYLHITSSEEAMVMKVKGGESRGKTSGFEPVTI